MIVEVADPSQVAEARRRALELAAAEQLDEDASGRVALLVTEMATNLIKHAQRGEIVMGPFADEGGAGLEIMAMDNGPGIAHVNQAIADGYSTAGSAGTGLGAIRRQADQFEIYSRANAGTIVSARVRRSAAAVYPGVAISAISEPIKGERVCGDAWAFGMGGGCPTVLVVDGSGHGPQAAAAAAAAIRVFRERIDDDCTSLVRRIHRGMEATRGGAVAVARIDAEAHVVRFVGLGNIAARVISNGEMKHMVSNNGIAGHVAASIREFAYPYQGKAVVVLHSDGLSSKWDWNAYTGLWTSHPSVIAATLFHAYRRQRDDALVVAIRN